MKALIGFLAVLLTSIASHAWLIQTIDCDQLPPHAASGQRDRLPNGGYGFCQIASCETGFELSKNRCMPPASADWFSQTRSLDAGDFILATYARLNHAPSGTVTVSISTASSTASSSDFELLTPNAVFNDSQYSEPIYIKVKRPVGDVAQRSISLMLSSVDSGSASISASNELTVTLNALSTTPILLRAENASVTAGGVAHVNVNLSAVSSKLFPTFFVLHYSTGDGSAVVDHEIHASIPANSTSVVVDVPTVNRPSSSSVHFKVALRSNHSIAFDKEDSEITVQAPTTFVGGSTSSGAGYTVVTDIPVSDPVYTEVHYTVTFNPKLQGIGQQDFAVVGGTLDRLQYNQDTGVADFWVSANCSAADGCSDPANNGTVHLLLPAGVEQTVDNTPSPEITSTFTMPDNDHSIDLNFTSNGMDPTDPFALMVHLQTFDSVQGQPVEMDTSVDLASIISVTRQGVVHDVIWSADRTSADFKVSIAAAQVNTAVNTVHGSLIYRTFLSISIDSNKLVSTDGRRNYSARRFVGHTMDVPTAVMEFSEIGVVGNACTTSYDPSLYVDYTDLFHVAGPFAVLYTFSEPIDFSSVVVQRDPGSPGMILSAQPVDTNSYQVAFVPGSGSLDPANILTSYNYQISGGTAISTGLPVYWQIPNVIDHALSFDPASGTYTPMPSACQCTAPECAL
jgi:hypothetical protein